MIESDEHSSLLHYIYETDSRFFLAETCLFQVNIFAPKNSFKKFSVQDDAHYIFTYRRTISQFLTLARVANVIKLLVSLSMLLQQNKL
jgi:hypothetical protein